MSFILGTTVRQIRSFSWFECRKIRTRKNSEFGHFSHSGGRNGTTHGMQKYSAVYSHSNFHYKQR